MFHMGYAISHCCIMSKYYRYLTLSQITASLFVASQLRFMISVFSDATIKSPKMFKMSSTHLVLPKLSLIGRQPLSSPKSPAQSPKELLEEGLLNRKAAEVTYFDMVIFNYLYEN